jgi:alpha-beta hydrolase superfamily lysophospholipase
MHAHGGPAGTGPSNPKRSLEDLERWAVTVQAGYAWAGSTYRRGGYGVTMAAEDTERLRKIFVRQFGKPRRTILHGQSYGGGVASKGAELFGGKNSAYDGVLLTSGVLGGGVNAYDFRLDLRVVYQYVCRNHPKPDEPQYPLWMGLPSGSTLTHAELKARIDECTGVSKPAAQRSPQQAANLATILNVVRIPEKTLVAHMNWATWLFQDLTQLRLGGRNPFSNVGAMYTGSSDDKALNRGVLRYAADPVAVQELAKDSLPDGHVTMPTLTMHAIDDPTAFVELESAYKEIREHAGTGNLLVQTFAAESVHSFLSAPEYVALFASLLDWIDHGTKPSPQSVLQLCERYESHYAGGCHIRPEYAPRPLSTRVTPRP